MRCSGLDGLRSVVGEACDVASRLCSHVRVYMSESLLTLRFVSCTYSNPGPLVRHALHSGVVYSKNVACGGG